MTAPCRILIVEDEMIIALDLSETLASRGYHIIDTVPSGEEAVRCCATERPDLVLMDIRLQGELNGLQTARILRERDDIPSIILSAFFDDAMLQEAQAAKVLAYLIKPYDERELCATIATALLRFQEENRLRQAIRSLEDLGGKGNIVQEDRESQVLFTCFPSLQLTLGNIRLSEETLTRTQRNLLGLILSSPHGRIERNDLEAELWPDAPPSRSHANLDTTLMRLRRMLQLKFGLPADRDFLISRNGIVALEGYNCDLDHFERLSNQGRSLRRNGDPAGATIALEQSCALWQGEFLADISSYERIEVVRRYTTQRFLENCLILADLYALTGRSAEGLVILNRAQLVDPTSELTTTQLYIAYRRNAMQGAALQLLHNYKGLLIKEGLTSLAAIDSIKKIERSAELILQQQR